MIEPTITQNCALYFAHHRASKRPMKLFERLGLVARQKRIVVKPQRGFGHLFLSRSLNRADKS